jgi:subtilisin family serine protease
MEGDLCGHGTACAGVIREIAPDAGIYSVRVLGSGYTGSGDILVAGLRWGVEQGELRTSDREITTH